LREEVATQTERAPIRLALNAVGGERAANRKRLAPNGTIVTYGAMSLQPLRIPNGLLILRILAGVAFGLTNGRQRYHGAAHGCFSTALRDGKARIAPHQSGKAYPLKDFAAAVARAAQSKRDGKVIFKLGD
jgi:trans-2-enoyl-CoA reductase